MAVVDISKGAKQEVLMSDVDGLLRKASEEEKIRRTWNRHQLRDNEYLLKMGLWIVCSGNRAIPLRLNHCRIYSSTVLVWSPWK